MRGLPAAAVVMVVLLASSPARAAQCEPAAGFDAWLDGFKREAIAAGISQKTLSSAFTGVAPDAKIIGYDRNQKVFRQTFEEFSGRMISLNRLQKGGNLIKQNAALLTRIEQEFGVQGPVLVAIWGLETDFGTVVGKKEVIRSVATLAFDCRRTDMFQAQLMDALRIVERGDLRPAEMLGDWAGDFGQTQFLPSSYYKFAIDFDGDGRRDLVRSVPDVLASTANYLKGYGWKAGQRWNEGDPNFEAIRGWNKAFRRRYRRLSRRRDRL